MSMEIIWNAMNYISEEMGIALRNTAYSPNIRDRLDHSCAILSYSGELVAQAEHIPVHIGSMAVGLRNTIDYLEREGIELDDGDVVIVNDPYIAGTHLNDITLIRPVYYGGKLVAYIANKAHHVDVGGRVPGSIGGDVKTLEDEGVVIKPTKLVEKGVINRGFIEELSSRVRTPNYLKGDIHAQIASLNIGYKGLMGLLDKYGVDRLWSVMDESIRYVEKYLWNRLQSLGGFGVYYAEDYLEGYDGSSLIIEAKVEIRDDGINIDYGGTSREVDYPLNAVYGVTVAASVFAVKSVVDPLMPINHGIFNILSIYAPKSSILNPTYPHPVSGGNLETSQRIVDVLHKALSDAYPDRVPAASCGSMNNIMVGGDGWAFYETVGGGSGGRPGGDGVDGVHTNMTNTLNTPIEILEREYPIQFEMYMLRRDSCGYGMYRGGLGLTRAFKVLSKAILTIMSDRVMSKPYGLKDGLAGSPGQHYIIRRGGDRIVLPSKATVELEPGDTVYINTPGGGGWGDPRLRRRESIIEDLKEDRVSKQFIERIYRGGVDEESES